jgi:hypothetical protein
MRMLRVFLFMIVLAGRTALGQLQSLACLRALQIIRKLRLWYHRSQGHLGRIRLGQRI